MTTTAEAPPRPMHPDTAAAVAAGERFTRDTADHQMTVRHDDGLYRHLLFKKPGASFYWYELITWPGTLVINGDMGSWTFARDTDMFAFFRSNPDRKAGDKYRINPHYWGEKLQGNPGGRASAQQYDRDVLANHLRTIVADDYTQDLLEWPAPIRRRLTAAVEDLIADMRLEVENEHNDLQLADAFEFRRRLTPREHNLWYQEWADVNDAFWTTITATRGPEEWRFSFDWDHLYDDGPFRSYDPTFLWCLHAIVTGIETYDATKTGDRETGWATSVQNGRSRAAKSADVETVQPTGDRL